MYPASDAFHEAVRGDARQTPLILFQDALMTADDICISSGGISYRTSVMDGENFAPGACVAAELTLDIINDDGRWNTFAYGEFKAYLGALTVSVENQTDAACEVTPDGHAIRGYRRSPYLTIDGEASGDVDEPVTALALIDEKLFVITDHGYKTFSYSDGTITETTFFLYAPQLEKQMDMLREENKSVMFGHTGVGTGRLGENNFAVWQNGWMNVYEMVPLGVFNAKRPVFSSRKTISVTCADRMERFDVMVQSGDFKTTSTQTIAGIVSNVCESLGIEFDERESDMLCGNVKPGWTSWGKVPEKIRESTLRDVIQWIAEATATFGMMSRDGKLILKWIPGDPVFELTENDYSDCDVAYFEAAGVSRLVIRDNDNDKDDNVTGEGDNSLYITDNPFALLMR